MNNIVKDTLIKSFDKLRTNGNFSLIPLVACRRFSPALGLNLSIHEFKSLNQRFLKTVLFLCLLCGLNTISFAQGKHNAARGQLLYETHCIACHTTEIHWREQKLVKNWEGLLNQVKRWQYIGGLSWSEDEVTDVAYHLDTLFYHYKSSSQLMNKD